MLLGRSRGGGWGPGRASQRGAGTGTLSPGCPSCSARACRKDGAHTDTVHPPFKPWAAIAFFLVDSLQRAEALSALFPSTLNITRNRINKVILAPSRCPPRDRFTGERSREAQWTHAPVAPPAHTPCFWDFTKPTSTRMSLQASEYSSVNVSFNPIISLSIPSPQYFNTNSGNFRGERTTSSVQCLPSPFYRWGN